MKNFPPFSNLIEMVDYTQKTYQNPTAFNFLQDGKWQNLSTKQFASQVEVLALALKEIGLKPKKGFGIIATSSPTWLIFNFAAMAIGAISVPIFPNISSNNLLFEINNSAIEFFFCDSEENLQILLEAKIKFKKIVVCGFKNKAKNKNIIDLAEIIEIGKNTQQKNPAHYAKLVKKIKDEDIATIIYTSGSTGIPKGVEITHANLVAQINGAHQFFPLKSDTDVALSFLPLAHIFEGMVISYYIACGISIYFADDVKNVGNLLRSVKPTLMTVVPRMLEKSYAKMQEKVNDGNFIKKLIGNLAFKLALKTNPDQAKIPLYFLFDKLVYQKLQEAMGGNLKMMICGGAALAPDLENFFNNIGIDLFIGYGLTESSPVIAANSPQAKKIGTIGKKFPQAEVKIKNGELLTRGAYIMKGYHKDKKRTAEVIDEKGWLHTGDLAQIDHEGFIKILGRKKELFKTSGGKYVSPVPIEQKILQNCSFLGGGLIIAEGKKFVSCLLFADFESLRSFKKRMGLENLSNVDFLKSTATQKLVANAIAQVNKDLNHWEKIKKFALISEELSIENGDLTPSMKLKRGALEEKYRTIINDFYS